MKQRRRRRGNRATTFRNIENLSVVWYLLVLIEHSCRELRQTLFPTPTGKTMTGKRLR